MPRNPRVVRGEKRHVFEREQIKLREAPPRKAGSFKNTHLQRCAQPSSLRRTKKYASFLLISRALHLDVFDQPLKNCFFNNPLTT
jgi:hypothetical protein